MVCYLQNVNKGTAKISVDLYTRTRQRREVALISCCRKALVTWHVLFCTQFILSVNKIPYLLPPLKGKDMQTAQGLSVPCHGGTMRRATECVSDRDIEQSAKCRITKSSLETVKCRPVWGQGLIVRYWSCTGAATTAGTVVTTLLSNVLRAACQALRGKVLKTVTCNLRSRLTDWLTDQVTNYQPTN
jgi:hypothetical protein